MTDFRKEVEVTKERFPTHQDIERRAYEIYLECGQKGGHADEHWFIAKDELLKKTTIPAGADGVIESDRAFAVAEEKLAQVRASETLKEEREGSTLPRTKTVSVGQQRSK